MRKNLHRCICISLLSAMLTLSAACAQNTALYKKLPQNMLSQFPGKHACGSFLSLTCYSLLFTYSPLLLQPFFYSATVTIVICGFTPSYQYRKPCISMVWPISSASTVLYTSVVLSHR